MESENYKEILNDIVNGNISEARQKLKAENKDFLLGFLLYAEENYGHLSGLIQRLKKWGVD